MTPIKSQWDMTPDERWQANNERSGNTGWVDPSKPKAQAPTVTSSGQVLDDGSGFQRKSEGRLSLAERALGRYQNNGQNLLNAGTARVAAADNFIAPLQGKLGAIAGREPSWYEDQGAVDSNAAFDESQKAIQRNMTRMGINPNSGRFAGLQHNWALARAAAEAGARTRGSRFAEQSAVGKLLNAIQLGQGDRTAGYNLIGQGMGADSNAFTGFRQLADDYGSMGSALGRYSEMNKSAPTVVNDGSSDQPHTAFPLEESPAPVPVKSGGLSARVGPVGSWTATGSRGTFQANYNKPKMSASTLAKPTPGTIDDLMGVTDFFKVGQQ